jgi:hypothetical protein
MQLDCESRIETLTSLNKDLDSQLLDLTEQLEKAKLEAVTAVRSVPVVAEDLVEDLKTKLEVSQQQNAKLKTKLKQLLEKSKAKQVNKSEDISSKSSESIGFDEAQSAEISEVQSENLALRRQLTEQGNELERLNKLVVDLEAKCRHSPMMLGNSYESLVEQKQKTIDGLTGVLNLTSAQLEGEKYNNQMALASMQNEIYERDVRISELRSYIDVISMRQQM